MLRATLLLTSLLTAGLAYVPAPGSAHETCNFIAGPLGEAVVVFSYYDGTHSALGGCHWVSGGPITIQVEMCDDPFLSSGSFDECQHRPQGLSMVPGGRICTNFVKTIPSSTFDSCGDDPGEVNVPFCGSSPVVEAPGRGDRFTEVLIFANGPAHQALNCLPGPSGCMWPLWAGDDPCFPHPAGSTNGYMRVRIASG